VIRSIRRLLFAAALSLTACLPAQIDRDGPAISPFRGMRQVDGGIEVQVLDNTWYALESVAGVDTKTLLQEAKRLCPRDDWKRITEDLPALLDAMGHEVGVRVDVRVRSLTNGDVQTFEGVEMTHDNRQRVKRAQGRRARDAAIPVMDELFGRQLTREQAREDLAVLEQLLETRFAYRELRGVDLDAALQTARAACRQGLRVRDFTEVTADVLRAFGDGHSRVRGGGMSNALWAPFLVQQVDGGHVAFRADRTGFVDAEHPFVVAIDGVPLARWLEAAKARATKGSAVMQGQQAERGLRELSNLRRRLQLPASDELELTLRGAGGEVTVTLPVQVDKPLFGAWPRGETRTLAGDIGYLRIERMDDDDVFLEALDRSMARFEDTNGLIIDVRGNGGGTRDALRRLAPYFLPAGGPPVVGNVAAFLREQGKPAPADALADRYLYRADWEGWTDAQRDAIAAFLRGFEPSWKLPRGRFTPWHFLVLDRAQNPDAFVYGKPVVVLIDRGCFSATDVFAAAMQAIPNVTLVGEATAGGSGRARGYRLPNSGVRLQLSTMASFRPDGVLFEGNGVAPDVAVVTQPTDLIGETDTALQKALDLLR